MTTPAVADLLGVLAYGELVAFERIAADAAHAPTVGDKIELGRIAAAEFSHFEKITSYLQAHGIDPQVAMEPFVDVFNHFHENMAPNDWYEGLLKVYVGDGIASDFYREISAYLDEDARKVVDEVLSDNGHSEFAINRLREAIALDPKVAGRLALWGRRIMGEMISQAAMVAGTRMALAELFVAKNGPESGNELSGVVNRLTVAHSRRMDALGLAS